MKLETHPFPAFVPENAKYLLLGSFIAVRKDDSYDFYYGKKVNQFWPILEAVYQTSLPDKKSRQALFTKLAMAVTDIIYQCERKAENSMDTSLINCIYNTQVITKVLKANSIQKIFFTSKFVGKEFKRHFKNLMEEYSNIELITLPSPSPRYAKMKKEEKISIYKTLFPKIP